MITEHEVKVYLTLASDPNRWWTSQETAAISGVAGRTVRAHLRRLADDGYLHVSNTHPAHRYKVKLDNPSTYRYKEEVTRLADVYGVTTEQKMEGGADAEV